MHFFTSIIIIRNSIFPLYSRSVSPRLFRVFSSSGTFLFILIFMFQTSFFIVSRVFLTCFSRQGIVIPLLLFLCDLSLDKFRSLEHQAFRFFTVCSMTDKCRAMVYLVSLAGFTIIRVFIFRFIFHHVSARFFRIFLVQVFFRDGTFM